MSESLNERKEKSFWKVPWGRCGPVATCRARPDSARPQLQKQHGARGDVLAGKGAAGPLGAENRVAESTLPTWEGGVPKEGTRRDGGTPLAMNGAEEHAP